MKKLIAAILFMTASASAGATAYTLPSGPNVALAQLMTIPEYRIVCDTDTVIDTLCDVPAGEYHLVVFDASWEASHSDITIESPGSSPVSPITLVTERCVGGPNTKQGCRATCPVGSMATGGACDVSAGFSVDSTAQVSSYTCGTALTPNDLTLSVIASVYCLSP